MTILNLCKELVHLKFLLAEFLHTCLCLMESLFNYMILKMISVLWFAGTNGSSLRNMWERRFPSHQSWTHKMWALSLQISSPKKISSHCSPWKHVCARLTRSPPIFRQTCSAFLAASTGNFSLYVAHWDWAKGTQDTDATSAGWKIAASSD